MKTHKVLSAIVLMAVSLFAAPSALAGPAEKVITVKFSYQRAAAPEAIYTRLEKTARRACNTPGPISFKDRRMARACEAEIIDAVLAKMQRLDVAALHYRQRGLMVAAKD